MILLKLTVSNIPKDRIFVGKKGKYLDLVLHENKDGPDQYQNDGFAAISVSKEEREAGVKGPIVGNWRHVGQKPAPAPPRPATGAGRAVRQPDPMEPGDEDDIPFAPNLC